MGFGGHCALLTLFEDARKEWFGESDDVQVTLGVFAETIRDLLRELGPFLKQFLGCPAADFEPALVVSTVLGAETIGGCLARPHINAVIWRAIDISHISDREKVLLICLNYN